MPAFRGYAGFHGSCPGCRPVTLATLKIVRNGRQTTRVASKKSRFLKSSQINQTFSSSPSRGSWEVTLVLAKHLEALRLRFGDFSSWKSPPNTFRSPKFEYSVFTKYSGPQNRSIQYSPSIQAASRPSIQYSVFCVRGQLDDL